MNKRKLLLISPNYFEYTNLIKKSIENNYNLSVDIYFDANYSLKIVKAIARYFPLLFNIINYFFIKSKFKNNFYDCIFVINGESLNSSSIKFLKSISNSIILYLWDSFNNKKYISEKIKLYSRSFSFDYSDTKKNKELFFLPLFFIEYKKPTNKKYKFDLFFVGTEHSSRFKKILKIVKFSKSNYVKFYFQAKWFFYLKVFFGLISLKYKNLFTLKKIPYDEYIFNLSNSKCVIDFAHPSQTGLTMRTIESVGLSKKIITDNQNIKNYSFYNSENIFILTDGYKDDDLIKFIKTDIQQYPNVKNYSIDSWLKTIFHNII